MKLETREGKEDAPNMREVRMRMNEHIHHHNHIDISMLRRCVCWLLVMLTTLPQSFSEFDHSVCKDSFYNCGKLQNISYPFWGQNRSSECGGGETFQLTCHDAHNTSSIQIGSQNFTVIEARNDSMRVRAELGHDVCSLPSENIYVNPTQFLYLESPSVYNITIFHHCRYLAYNSSEYELYSFPCGDNSFSYYFADFMEPDEELINELSRLCKGRLHVPTDAHPEDYAGDARVALEKVLEKGFVVKYNVGEECPDGSHALHCSSKSTLNLPRKIIIGVGSAVVGALAVGIGVYLYWRRKKNSYVTYIQSRSLSFDPSLKDTEKGTQSFTQSFVHGMHLFSYDELEEATNYFDSSKELGEGGFGTVYYGKLRDGRSVAVKRLYENNYRRVEQFMNEIKILALLKHPNLVSLYGCTSRHSRELLLVYEYIPNGTVADHLHSERSKPGTLPWLIRMNIAVETASALTYLHVKDIIHRDVKTNNILLDSNFRVKVADFGLSRLFPEHVTHVSTAPQGTPGYVDPEYHECYQLTNKSDVYSFGVVLVELISSLPAVDITRHRHEINLANMAINKIHSQALHELVDPTLGFESDFKVRKMINAVAELAFQCLQSSKDMRPSMEEVFDTLKDIQSDGKHKSQPEVMDISSTADDVVLLKDNPPPPSPDSNAVSKSTTPNASG
ncbi:LEAF RUST 10 DISEASE-RESISTANCE LOCUS RECEPTOR-LIKE PROTEIN KINASE-like 1.2 isoform X2 [Cajanus cajan]|uniref:LEAF RUST 10 DISEASE-RESISTANCE LOCUS RECEPTOR-LIKE PROTEIN KINASE-like 1.2 isoform X2 n=1 Tax=Cajanus cajan TaxID=3821 RepID=UPI00098DCBCB|nr:LEAF RUST 10 DISEASE-RESISTANCE LOCUS RECEPTOR-LIKE PROTEIN KINASE-like 1.2 isoform X2 [Cajanus cajan]